MLQDQVAHNLFQGAYEEHNAGRIPEGIALLSRSYEFAARARSDDRLRRLHSDAIGELGLP